MVFAPTTDDAEPSKSDAFKAIAKCQASGEESAEHILKLTKFGRPFHKDTVDLFATFIVASELKPHRLFFRTYQNSFSTDEALQTLESLKFSQSTRTADPEDPSSFITTTTNFVFSMTRQVAMELCQHFMDARFVQNALDPSLNLFKDKSLHCLTPKGLHVLKRFIEKNGIDADHLQSILDSEIVCSKLFHLERESAEDSLKLPYNNIISLFRWFVGQQPNYVIKDDLNLLPLEQYSKHSKGIELMNIVVRSGLRSLKAVQRQHCFDAPDALEWLCNFTSVGGREEAAGVAAHFERLGLIVLVGNPEKYSNRLLVFTAHGSPNDREYDSTVKTQGEFRCVRKAYYQVTDKGRRVAGWDSTSSTPESFTETISDEIEEQAGDGRHVTSSDRLYYILKEPCYRSLFRAFLQDKLCEEHILFWFDVDIINRKFNVTSSAISGAATSTSSSSGTQVKQDRKKHHQALLRKAVHIYKSYLHPTSQFELNTDYTLRNELFRFIDSIPFSPSLSHEKRERGGGPSADLEERTARIMSSNGEHLKGLMKHFKQIQLHTFRVMLMDSLPKFVQTEKFIALQQQSGDINLRIAGADSDYDSTLLSGEGEVSFSYSHLVN